MVGEVQIFAAFRWMLAIICTIYALLVTAQTLRSWLIYFLSGRRYKILGRYTLALLLRIRLRQFALELAQIAALLGFLFFLVYAHRWLE